jgi:hypothetical protein
MIVRLILDFICFLDLVFPRDLDKFSLSMSFDFKEYKRRYIFDQPYMAAKGTIRLPVAKNIQDKFHAEWDKTKTDPMTGAVIESMLYSMQKTETNNSTITSVFAGIVILPFYSVE